MSTPLAACVADQTAALLARSAALRPRPLPARPLGPPIAPGDRPAAPSLPKARLGREHAARLLAQAAFGGTPADLARAQALGPEGWLAEQMALPPGTRYQDLLGAGPCDHEGGDGRSALERAIWRKLTGSPDVLRQRVTLALNEIFLTSIEPLAMPERGLACAALMDLLERRAFGTYRDLLIHLCTNPAMGRAMGHLNSSRSEPGTGAAPDEPSARQLLQRFTLGPVRLNPRGEPLDARGLPARAGSPAAVAFVPADVQGLARVLTGWRLGSSVADPMVNHRSCHELGPKTFLGHTIALGTDGPTSLVQAVDALMAHPNVAPFVSRLLIRHLVTANPTPAYVERVATAFKGEGSRVVGDLQATLRAILTDDEAGAVATLADFSRGRLREPIVRFVQWVRTFGSVPAAPMAPALPRAAEWALPAAVKGFQEAFGTGVGVLCADPAGWLARAADTQGLLAELNGQLAQGRIPACRLTPIQAALEAIAPDTPAGQARRLLAAVALVTAAV